MSASRVYEIIDITISMIAKIE